MPGGAVVYPPERILLSVERIVPAFPLDRFSTIASMYHIERTHEPESPAAVRDKMERIAGLAIELRTELYTLSEEAMNTFDEAGYRTGEPRVSVFLIALEKLRTTAMAGEMLNIDPPGGRPRGALAALVSRLAGVMQQCDIPVDAKPRGDLVFLTRQVLDGYGIEQGPVLKAVQRYLDKTTAATG